MGEIDRTPIKELSDPTSKLDSQDQKDPNTATTLKAKTDRGTCGVLSLAARPVGECMSMRRSRAMWAIPVATSTP